MEEVKLSLSELIDCSEEVFRDFCADKDLGYISGLHNLFMLTFNEVKQVKDDLVVKMAQKDEIVQVERDTLNGLYAKLLRIEHRVFLLRECIDSRKLQ